MLVPFVSLETALSADCDPCAAPAMSLVPLTNVGEDRSGCIEIVSLILEQKLPDRANSTKFG